jgi:hypothetical protein
MKFKLLILPACLLVGLGAIYFLPSAGAVANSAIRMKLPAEEGAWFFKEIPPSAEEIEALAKDTAFSKAICLKPRPDQMTADGKYIPDRLDLSIVLSGYDLNNSIHRPERCMPAQGHHSLSGSNVPIHLDNGRTLTVRRLTSKQSVKLSESTKTDLSCVTYYFFVGHDRLSHDHLQRTFIDMKDRVIRGIDQRWAYASISTWFGTMPPEWFGKLSDDQPLVITEAEADKKVVEFLKGFAEDQIDWKQMK